MTEENVPQTTMSPETARNLHEIQQIIEDRESTFSKVFFGIALRKVDEISVIGGVIRFLSKDDPIPEEAKYDYGTLLIVLKALDVKKTVDLIKDIVEHQHFKVDPENEIRLKATLSRPVFVRSSVRFCGPVSHDWPKTCCRVKIDEGSGGTDSRRLLTTLDLPYFPTEYDAIVKLLGFDPSGHRDRLEDVIQIVVPDFRAKITKFRIGGEQITVEVETGTMNDKDLRAKLYVKSETEIDTSENLVVKDGQAVFETSIDPEEVDAIVISLHDNNTIDRKRVRLGASAAQEGVVFEKTEDWLMQMIEGGENKTVEFKQDLDKSNNYLKSVVAFANTIGGVMIIGVSDDGMILGWKGDTEELLNARIEELCYPPIDIVVTEDIPLEGKSITLVEVSEGKKKPYIMKDKGILVRRGSSSRQIKRIELDAMYQGRGVDF